MAIAAINAGLYRYAVERSERGTPYLYDLVNWLKEKAAGEFRQAQARLARVRSGLAAGGPRRGCRLS